MSDKHASNMAKILKGGSCWVRPLEANWLEGGIEVELPVALIGTEDDALLVAPVYTTPERAEILAVGLRPVRVLVSHLEDLLPSQAALAVDFGHDNQQMIGHHVWRSKPTPFGEISVFTDGEDNWISHLRDDLEAGPD